MYYKFTEFLAKSKENPMHSVEQPVPQKRESGHSGSIYGRSILSLFLRELGFCLERLILCSGTLFVKGKRRVEPATLVGVRSEIARSRACYGSSQELG